MMNPRFDDSFRELVRSWENHARAAKAGSISELAQARAELDAARVRAAQMRRLVA